MLFLLHLQKCNLWSFQSILSDGIRFRVRVAGGVWGRFGLLGPLLLVGHGQLLVLAEKGSENGQNSDSPLRIPRRTFHAENAAGNPHSKILPRDGRRKARNQNNCISHKILSTYSKKLNKKDLLV